MLRQRVEDLERDRWIRCLAVLLFQGRTPISADISTAADLGRSKRVGRASTLRKQVRMVKFILWRNGAYDLTWPSAPFQFVDYLEERASEACGLTVLLKTFMFPSVANFMQEITRYLEEASPVATRTSNSDVQGIDMKSVVLETGDLEGTLRRTKTTGPGKSSKSIQFYVSKDCWLDEVSWLQVGWQLWSDLGRGSGLADTDFLMPVPSCSLDSLTKKVASYADAAMFSKALLSGLASDEVGGKLLCTGMAAFWTTEQQQSAWEDGNSRSTRATTA